MPDEIVMHGEAKLRWWVKPLLRVALIAHRMVPLSEPRVEQLAAFIGRHGMRIRFG